MHTQFVILPFVIGCSDGTYAADDGLQLLPAMQQAV